MCSVRFQLRWTQPWSLVRHTDLSVTDLQMCTKAKCWSPWYSEHPPCCSKGSSQHSSRWVVSPYRYWGVIERMLQVVGEGFCPVCPSISACPASAALGLQGCSSRSRKKRAISMLYFSELSKDQSFGGGMRVHILARKVNLQNERKCRISKYKILLID